MSIRIHVKNGSKHKERGVRLEGAGQGPGSCSTHIATIQNVSRQAQLHHRVIPRQRLRQQDHISFAHLAAVEPNLPLAPQLRHPNTVSVILAPDQAWPTLCPQLTFSTHGFSASFSSSAMPCSPCLRSLRPQYLPALSSKPAPVVRPPLSSSSSSSSSSSRRRDSERCKSVREKRERERVREKVTHPAVRQSALSPAESRQINETYRTRSYLTKIYKSLAFSYRWPELSACWQSSETVWYRWQVTELVPPPPHHLFPQGCRV